MYPFEGAMRMKRTKFILKNGMPGSKALYWAIPLLTLLTSPFEGGLKTEFSDKLYLKTTYKL